MKLLIIANPTSPATDYYRTTGVFTRMAEDLPGIELQIEYPTNVKWHHMYTADAVVFQRPNGKDILEFIVEARRMGKKIVLDIDDLLHGLTYANPAAKHFNDANTIDSMNRALQMADLLIVSTPHLADFYGKLTSAPVVIAPNCPDLRSTPFVPIQDLHHPIRVMWRGSTTHLADLYTISNVWNQLATNKHYSLLFIGVERFLMPWFEGNATFIGWQTLFALFEGMSTAGADIGLFPLTNEPFNVAKSNIFALEMLCAGAIPIAPEGLPEFEHPGVLTYKNPMHLQLILQDIKTKKIDKAATIEAGREWIMNERDLLNVNKVRFDALKSIV